LRHQGEGANAAGVAARLVALSDDDVDAVGLHPARRFDIADEAKHGDPGSVQGGHVPPGAAEPGGEHRGPFGDDGLNVAQLPRGAGRRRFAGERSANELTGWTLLQVLVAHHRIHPVPVALVHF
jgi:hypothetical protein